MNRNKKKKNEKCVKLKTFIDKNFGERIEYCLIREGKSNILIYSNGKENVIFRTRNMDHLLQEFIMLKEERDFLRQENIELLNDIEQIKCKTK